MKRSLIALAAISSIAIGTPAFAETMKVHYSDLNLANAEGQHVLAKRIDRAARKVCKLDQLRTGTRIPSASAKRCYKQAKATAHAQMAVITNNAQLGG